MDKTRLNAGSKILKLVGKGYLEFRSAGEMVAAPTTQKTSSSKNAVWDATLFSETNWLAGSNKDRMDWWK